MVAHLWAHQMQDHARNSGSNFYFHDEHIYSYGSHFRCGSVVRNREGQTAYLITDRTYSSTTGRHMAHVRNAIPAHRMVFTTDRLGETRNDKLTEYFYRQAIYYIVDRVERIDELAYKQKRARRCDYISDIEDELCGLRFRISSRSFYQINSVQTEKLYRKAMELAGLTGKERVIDAYCGIGSIGLIASDKAKEVISVELNPDAVRDAIVNAKRNGI